MLLPGAQWHALKRTAPMALVCIVRYLFIYFPLPAVYRRLSSSIAGACSDKQGPWVWGTTQRHSGGGWECLQGSCTASLAGTAGHPEQSPDEALFAEAGGISASCISIIQGFKPDLGRDWSLCLSPWMAAAGCIRPRCPAPAPHLHPSWVTYGLRDVP